MRIIIDPRTRYNYASWYILGLCRVYGVRNIKYDLTPFLDGPYCKPENKNAGVSMLLEDGNSTLKVYINFWDVAVIDDDDYKWCDVYGMVNPTAEQVEKYKEKMVVLGPEFGVKLANPVATTALCLRNYLKMRGKTSKNLRGYLSDYAYSFVRRRSIEAYKPITDPNANYIFHASTLWYNNFAKECTNHWRIEFLKACRKAGIEIEGGLYFIGESPSVLREMPDYGKYKETCKGFIYDKRLSMDDYIMKTKMSVMVFNVPSVCGCHGWKLAEYLCMGKAIISTPLSREMPCPMEHGKNIHFVTTEEELYEAVAKINNDAAYRQQLEQGARDYYEEWIAPEVQIKRLTTKRK